MTSRRLALISARAGGTGGERSRFVDVMTDRHHLSLVSKQSSGDTSREMVRLLGRQLGDIIRDQHGQAAFDRVEGLRRHVVNEHRHGRTVTTLVKQLSHLPDRELVVLIRAFAIFSQLANTADDYAARCEAEREEKDALQQLK